MWIIWSEATFIWSAGKVVQHVGIVTYNLVIWWSTNTWLVGNSSTWPKRSALYTLNSCWSQDHPEYNYQQNANLANGSNASRSTGVAGVYSLIHKLRRFCMQSTAPACLWPLWRPSLNSRLIKSLKSFRLPKTDSLSATNCLIWIDWPDHTSFCSLDVLSIEKGKWSTLIIPTASSLLWNVMEVTCGTGIACKPKQHNQNLSLPSSSHLQEPWLRSTVNPYILSARTRESLRALSTIVTHNNCNHFLHPPRWY